MATPINSYRDLIVWQLAIDLAEQAYVVTRAFPKDELYGLTSQVRRSATSVAANIAEGYGRQTRPAFISFLRIAQGSLKELETHLIVAERVKLMPAGSADTTLALSDRIGRMLRALIQRLGKP